MKGLSSAEAVRRLEEEGHNEIPAAESVSFLKTILNVLKEPMILLLVACAGIYFATGEFSDAAILGFSVFIVAFITISQERKAERALEALRSIASPRTLVLRDGREVRIASREIVPGDLIILHEGDRITADAKLISSNHFKVDESILTGESFPVSKHPESKDDERALLYSGTLVVAGSGIAEVFATGLKTKFGQIGQSLGQSGDADRTLLQKEIARLVKVFAIVGIIVSGLVAVLYGLTRGPWLDGILAGLAAAMSLLPEEFPVVLTVFLALGAWRISKVQVLTRRISATESLGSITTLCVDKTGTLTKNRMAVRAVHCEGRTLRINDGDTRVPSACESVVNIASLASAADGFDPMDRAVSEMRTTVPHGNIVREYPLSNKLLAVAHVWKIEGDDSFSVAAKGAPEAILKLCRVDEEEKRKILAEVQALSASGLRVLGVASARHANDSFPNDPAGFEFSYDGLLGFEDPIRPEVPAAIRECYSAGIRVVMITGDYAGTARSIARQIGLTNPDNVILGEEIERTSDEALGERIRNVNVFARMVPEQKLRIIKALKSKNQVVAMTGDGVNDAPSLKWADVGVAMGERGTDVAREAASIVLLDDNFASIVASVRMGRRIFDNIQKSVSFILSVHVPIAGMAILPIIFGMPLILFPAHIVFLELIIDPACALVFEAEPENPNIMKRPPRDLSKPLFGLKELSGSALNGFVALVAALGSFWFATYQGADDATARTVGFSSLVFANLGLIFSSRSQNDTLLHTIFMKNKMFWIVVAGTILFLIATIYIPPIQRIFSFRSLELKFLIQSAICTLFPLAATLVRRNLRSFS